MPDLLAWLADERNRRNVLVEADAYRPGVGEITHYFSTGGFVSRATDDPPHRPYPALVSKIPAISIQHDAPYNWGDIELRNPGGVLDHLFYDSFGFREVRLFLGDPGWAKADYWKVVLRAGRDGLQAVGVDQVRLSVGDALAALDTPVQTESIPNGNKLIPLALGKVFNVSPVFLGEDINGASYQVHESALASLAVRTGGLEIDPARLFPDLANGKFRIDPPPAGVPTCDVLAGATRVVEVAANLLARCGVEFDAVNFGVWNTICPQTVGIFIENKDTHKAVLTRLLESVGLRFHAWPDGIVRLYRVQEPSGDPVMVIPSSAIRAGGLSIKKTIPPLAALRLGYKRNHTVQDKGSLYGAVPTADAELYGRGWSVETAENAGLADIYPAALVLPGDITETALSDASHANDEAARRLAMYSSPIFEFEVDVFTDPVLMPGQNVLITHPRFGFDEGKLAQVVGFEWSPDKRRTLLSVWVWR